MSLNLKRKGMVILVLGALLILGACATRPMGAPGDPAFLRGLIDGVLAPISLVISFFNDAVRMYAFPNIGRWYDFGFLLGLSL
jgi:hypothetical protein